MKKLILLITLMLVSLTVRADFVPFGTTTSDNQFLLDYSSKRVNGSTVKIWVYTIYMTPIGEYHDTYSSKMLQIFDCKNEIYKSSYIVFYKDKEAKTILNTWNGNDDWKPLVPDSMWGNILKEVCK